MKPTELIEILKKKREELTKVKKAREDLEKARRNEARDYIFEHYYDDINLSQEFMKNLFIAETNYRNELDFDSIYKKYNTPEMYQLNTKMDYATTIEIATKFFSELDPSYANYFQKRINDKSGIKFGTNPYTNVESREVELTKYGDLRDLYTIVHEFSHLFDSSVKGDTLTRNILTETAAQSMERLLDSFLMQLDNNELAKYGFSKQQLNQDILERRISTFIQRMHSIQSIMPEFQNCDFGAKAADSGYMLAQIYSTKFSTLSYEEQKSRIKQLIDNISIDKFQSFDEFNKSDDLTDLLDIDLSVNNLNRGEILNETINNIVNDYKNLKNIDRSIEVEDRNIK